MTSGRFLATATALAFAVTALVYGRVVPGFFLADDFGGLALFRDLRAGELWSLFRIWEGQGHWRPLWGLLFWGIHSVFGLWAPVYHLAALLLHAGCGVLLAALVLRLTRSHAAGLWACVLFLVHPSQAPSLGWIASVQEPLVTSACLLALCAELRYLQRGGAGNALLALAATAAALMSKEAAVGLLPAAVALWWACPERRPGTGWLAGALCALVLAYLGFRIGTRSLPPSGLAGAEAAANLLRLFGDGALWLLGVGEPWGALALSVMVLAGAASHRTSWRAFVSLALVAAGFLLPQLPAYTGFTPTNTRLLHTVLAGVAGLFAVALAHARAGQLVLAALALASVWFGQDRLRPFVAAGQLSAVYHRELLRVLPPDAVPRDGKMLAFFTNEVPLPEGIERADYRFFWPPFGQVELAVQYGLRLPRPVFVRDHPGPDTVQAAVAEFGSILLIEIAGNLPERADYLRFIQERGRQLEPDPHLLVLFWDHRSQTLERFRDQDLFKR